MIHCLAGAHRAGCATISWLMYKENLSFEKATILAKEKRDRIDPIGSFPAVLIKLENALNNTEMRENVEATFDWKQDIADFQEASTKGGAKLIATGNAQVFEKMIKEAHEKRENEN